MLCYEGDRILDFNYLSQTTDDTLLFMEIVEQKISYREQIVEKHEKNMKKLLRFYRKLIEESEQAVEEIDQQCQDQINQDMAYALQYLEVCDIGVDMKRLSAAMNDVVFLYGLTDMLERGLALVRKFVPDKGEIYCMIIRNYFFNSSDVTDEEVMERLPGMISRRQYYREKKEAIRMMGYYFFEIVIPQMQKGRYQPAVMVGN